MISTIKINENQSVELNGSMGWLFVYNAQFGRDILPDLMPLIETLVDVAVNVMHEENDGTVMAYLANIDEDVISKAIIDLSGLELTTIINIIWAMAKNNDRSIAPPEDWVNQFDVFPVDEILPEAIKVIIQSSASTKNAKRLLKALKKK